MKERKYADLHCHTLASDGTLTPAELVKHADEIGLAYVAITDHDTVDGIKEAADAAKNLEVKVIPGIEIATHYTDKKETEIHIVGLFIDPENKTLNDMLKSVVESRDKRNHNMVNKLCDLGLKIDYDELIAISGGKIISRAHYARLLVSKGYVSDMYEAFSKYIGDGKKGFIKRTLPQPKEAIETIIAAGGVPILAHPTLYDMNYSQIRKMVDEFMSYGLKGIETMYSTYTPDQEREITKIAKEKRLLPSGGSDFHGTNKKGIFLGVGKGKLQIPKSFAETLGYLP